MSADVFLCAFYGFVFYYKIRRVITCIIILSSSQVICNGPVTQARLFWLCFPSGYVLMILDMCIRTFALSVSVSLSLSVSYYSSRDNFVQLTGR